ncbi:E3 ubiquitin-protein ligase NEURL3-like [Thalassophryne amazonica]|uniref:E3 ubiquitin-protein ligase NEURL3-like n=1 Tax=Thalassophryne amazonica TaxID=390379 RepID=UPI001471F9C0|nr:E3 ubiquitin-protein ligase NEURL3-like [Thalassophryne amazonica]
MIRLSMGGRFAERSNENFKDGLVFSSRPLKVQEKVRLRVQNVLENWSGSLRVGFTNVPPSSRTLPLPNVAIPKLTNTPGHWAAPLSAVHCGPGSELEFWVSAGGSLYFASNKSSQQELLTGVDLSKPLWAMIDIYGQTCSVFLLGSEKKEMFHTRKSCPVPEYLAPPDVDKDKHVPLHVQEPPSDAEMDCVVCMAEEATVTLNCGHQCLCVRCASRVIQEFGTCPLCRQTIQSPSVGGRCVLNVFHTTRHCHTVQVTS